MALTAAADDRLFGTANNDTFNAEAGTLQAGDSLLDQSSSDNDTLNAVINNANSNGGAGIAPTLLNIENVNLDLDVFSNAAFDAANTEGATITASSTKLGFNGSFLLDNTGDNNVVAGNNVTNLDVDGLESGSVDTGAAETASVETVAGSDGEVANVTVNGDIALTVATATDLNLTATADTVVELTRGAVDTIVGSGEGVITVEGNLTGVTNITGVDAVVVTSDAAVASDWEVNTISIAANVDDITVADAANVTIDEEQAAALTITGQGNTGSTVNVSSNLSALGSLVFADLAAAGLELTTAGVEVASLDAADVALTVNVANGAEFADLNGTNNIELVGAGDVVVENADGLSSLDASNLDGALEVTTAATAEINGSVGNNTIDFNANANLDFVGQAGDDSIAMGGVAFASEANLVLGASDDTVTLEENLDAGAAVAINFGEGNDTLVLEAGVNTSAADSLSLVGLETIQLAEEGVTDVDATVAASQISGASLAVRGQGFDNSTLSVVETTGEDATIDLSGLDVSDSASTGASFAITGGAGDDTITGTGLADTITVSSGVNTLTGGAGADTFTVNENPGDAMADPAVVGAAVRATITDFEYNVDELATDVAGAAGLVTAENIATWLTAAGVTAAAADVNVIQAGGAAALAVFEFGGDVHVGASAELTYDAGDIFVTLQGVSATDVDAAADLFAV